MPTTANRFFVGWRNWLARMIPNWQTRRPGAETGFKYLWALVAPIDILLELLLQGVNDWAPGSPNASPTALPLLGRSRGLIQGEAETADHFARRLVNWRTNGLAVAPPATPRVWSQRGRTELLALQIQQYLGNTPMVRIIERLYSTSGATQALYTTAATDGTTSTAVAAWDWDSVDGGFDADGLFTGPVARGYWSDVWIVVYPCEWPVTGATLASLVGVWGTTLVGTGHSVGPAAHDAIVAIVSLWKGCFTFVRAILWSYDAALFDPASPAVSGDPDGTFGYWATGSAPARTGFDDGRVRYWQLNRG